MRLLSDRRLDRMHRAVLNGRIIPYLAFVTGLITLAAALAVRLLARGEFTTFGESVWWAAQTVTTVGYGDVIPQTAFSKVIAFVVMMVGIAAVSLITAVTTSAVIEVTRRRRMTVEDDPHLEALARLEERLHRMEARLEGVAQRLEGA
jgi:voltage-gated potassium channel